MFARPEFAETLALIAETKGEAFYRGTLCDRILQQSKSEGGLLEHADFDSHEATWCAPITQSYGEITAHEIPPNGQGLATLIALGILDRLSTRKLEPFTADWTHCQVEAMKIAIRASFEYVADPAYMNVSAVQLLEDDVLDQLAKKIADDRAAVVPKRPAIWRGTLFYLTTADATGKMVSYIQSNYQGFGSGVVIKGTGIAMQKPWVPDLLLNQVM